MAWKGAAESSRAEVVRVRMGGSPFCPCPPSLESEHQVAAGRNLWAFPVLSSLEVILLGDLRGEGARSLGSPMEGRAVTLSQHMHTRACTHLHTRACTHSPAYVQRQTGPWTPQTHSHRRGITHRVRDAIPLPDSEKEPWIQMLASHQHRDTNTCVHTSLWRVMQKTREKRV